MDVDELADLSPDRRRALFDRDAGLEEVGSEVEQILRRVREDGDDAVRALNEELDGATVGNLAVTGSLERASEAIDAELREAMETAAENVRAFHERQRREDWREDEEGRELGRRFRPLERVGAYVPGGTATYPSSAIMTVVPAKVAGVEQVVVATPPADPVDDVTLAALQIAGADEVYQVGGAQAIGALAYGTETIPAVQKIVGPGNRWVTAAKQRVRDAVEIDFLAGPSEILVVADGTANPTFIAADLLAQAEHGPRSSCVLVTDDRTLAEETSRTLRGMLDDTPREAIASQALDHPASGILLARSMSEAIGFAEEYAAEHLSIQATRAEDILERIDSAGSVFLGPHTPVAAGDYASGTNHVLPTGGLAKVTGGLGVDTFVRSTTVQRLTRDGLADLAETIDRLAMAEGFPAHAESVRVRTDEE